MNGSGNGTLVNEGTLEKTAGTAASHVDQFFVNDGGTVVAQSGTLDLDFATYEGTSTFTAAQGALIDLGLTASGGVVGDGTITGTLTGSGAGTVQLSQSVSVGDAGLALRFTGAAFEWTAGTITPLGTGQVTNVAGSSVAIAAGGGEELTGDLINAGTIIQTGTGQVNLTPGSLTNQAGAVYDIQNTSLGVAVLQNSGLFEKSTGSGTSLIGNEVNNTGTIEVDAGGLAFFATGSCDQVSSRDTLTAGTWIVNHADAFAAERNQHHDQPGRHHAQWHGSELHRHPEPVIHTRLTLTGGASFTTTGDFTNAGTLTVVPAASCPSPAA